MCKRLSASEKITLLRRHLIKGEQIAELCRETGVSRTIFYQWLQIYQIDPQKAEQNLTDRTPRNEEHYKYIAVPEAIIDTIIREHPDFTIRQITDEVVLRLGEIAPGRQKIFEYLQSKSLSTAEQRTAYASESQQKQKWRPEFVPI